MAWYRKEDPTPFDDVFIPGLLFLHGDMLAQYLNYPPLRGHKYPEVEFPSGLSFALWAGEPSPIIHVFGEMDLPLYSTRDEALAHADSIAQQCGYAVQAHGDAELIVIGQDEPDYYRLTYDNSQHQLVDIQVMPDKPEVIHPAHRLMPDEVRATLPPLYATDQQGDQALAQVKYFLPGTQWTWYATEFDGDQIFFGLVVGFDVELGYFSLQDLQDAKGAFNLPVERDLSFTPTALADLKRLHR